MRPRKESLNKQDPQDFAEIIIHEFRIVFDRVSIQLKHLADGVANLDKKLNQVYEGLKAEINRSTQPILDIFVNLNRKPDKDQSKDKIEPGNTK